MGGVVVCPACKGKFRLAENVVPGNTVRCPHCSRAMSIGGPSQARKAPTPVQPTAPVRPTSAPADDPMWSGLAAASAAAPASPLGPPRRAKSDTKLVYIVGGIGGALVLLLSVVLIIVLSGNRDVATNSDVPAATFEVEQPIEETDLAEADEPASTDNPFETLAASNDDSSSVAGDTSQTESRQETLQPTSTGSAMSGQSPFDPAPAADSGGGGLLDRIQLGRDANGVVWTRRGTGIACTGGARWSLSLPDPPPAGYRWTMEIERLTTAGSIGLFVPVNNRPVMVVLEGYNGHTSGLSNLDGQSADRNETTYPLQIFYESRPVTIVCEVTRSRVFVTADGKPVVRWFGSADRLSYDRGAWPNFASNQLAVTSYEGVPVRIDRMEIEEIDAGQPMPHDGPPAFARNRGPFGSPWRRNGPGPSSPSPSPSPSPAPRSQPSPDSEPSPAVPGSSSVAMQEAAIIPIEELPEAVRRSKESVCIIEHPAGSGTGFVVGKNLVATNAHVVDGAYVEEITCQFSASGAVKCRANRVLFEDAVRDLCILDVETEQPPIPIVENHVLTRGEKVVIIGNPVLGRTDIVLRDAVTGGTIRAMVHTGKCDFYQIDGAVNPGSSGGPTLNYDGAVVGVIAMKATDQGENELRQALQKLDDSFASRFGSGSRRGIAFSIPVVDLKRAIDAVAGQSSSDADRVGDRHLATVLFDRMKFVGGIDLLRLQVDIPAGVRQQGEQLESQIRMRRIPAAMLNKIERMDLMPAYIARALSRALDDDELRKHLRTCESGMSTKVKHLAGSGNIDGLTSRHFEALHRTVLETKRYLEKPPSSYQAYAKAVNGQLDSFKEQIERLDGELDLQTAAYDQ